MQLQLKRLRFSKEADTWLRVMKSRTDITPNLLCRIAFCMSLEEPGVPDPAKYLEDSDREINRYTLLGEYDAVFVSLLRQRLKKDAIGNEKIDDHFRAHMNRGVIVLAGRLKELPDISQVCVGAASPESSGPRAPRKKKQAKGLRRGRGARS